MSDNNVNNIFAEKILQVRNSWYNPEALYKSRNSNFELSKDSEAYANVKIEDGVQSVFINGNNYQITTPGVNIRTTNYDQIEKEILKAKKEVQEKYNLFFQDYWNNNKIKYTMESIQSLNVNSSNDLNYNITKFSQRSSPNSTYQKNEFSPIDTSNKNITKGEMGGAAWQSEVTATYLEDMRAANYESFVMSSANNLYLNYGIAAKNMFGSALNMPIAGIVAGTIKSAINSGRVPDYTAKLSEDLSVITSNIFNVGKTDNFITGEVKGETHYYQRLIHAAASNNSLINSAVSLVNGDLTIATISGIGAALSSTGNNIGVTSLFAMYPSNAEAWRRTIRLMMFIDSPVFGTRIDRNRHEWDTENEIAIEKSLLQDSYSKLGLKSLKNQGFITNIYDEENNQSKEYGEILKHNPAETSVEIEDGGEIGELNPGPYKIYGKRLSQNLISKLIEDKNQRYLKRDSNREKNWLFVKTKDNSFGPTSGSSVYTPRKKDNEFKVYFNLIELGNIVDGKPTIKIKNRVDLPPTIMDFKDSVTPTWNSLEYAGRPTSGISYSGFQKSITFSFYLVGDSPTNHNKVFETISFFENVMRPKGFSYVDGMTGNILLFNMSNLISDNIVIVENFEKDIEGPWHLTTGMPMIYKCNITLKVLYDGAIESGFTDNNYYGYNKYPNFLEGNVGNSYLGGEVKPIDNNESSANDTGVENEEDPPIANDINYYK